MRHHFVPFPECWKVLTRVYGYFLGGGEEFPANRVARADNSASCRIFRSFCDSGVDVWKLSCCIIKHESILRKLVFYFLYKQQAPPKKCSYFNMGIFMSKSTFDKSMFYKSSSYKFSPCFTNPVQSTPIQSNPVNVLQYAICMAKCFFCAQHLVNLT